MTVYWNDLSNHDRTRYGGPLPMAAIRSASSCAAIVKMGEGTWTDPYAQETLTRARDAGFPVIGVYHVLWPGQAQQALWLYNRIRQLVPWLLDHACPVMMCDSELFAEFEPFRAPTLGEQHTFLDEFRALSGWGREQLWDYAPEWLYGSAIVSAIRYPWISSKYGGNPCGSFRTLYPGDASPRWVTGS